MSNNSPLEFVYKDSYGYIINLLVTEYNVTSNEWEAADVSSFTSLVFKIKKPDGTTVSIDGEFLTDGTDGYVTATLTAELGILDQSGFYEAQLLTSKDGYYLPTSIFGFKVQEPL